MPIILKKKTVPNERVSNALANFKAKQAKPLRKGKFEPWNLWKHKLHASGLTTFMLCPEQFKLTYLHGWQKPQTNESLEFGNCVHYVLEQGYRVRKPFNEKLVQIWIEEWLANYHNSGLFGISAQDLEIICGQAQALMPIYARIYAGDWKSKAVGTEVKWSHPYVYPDGKQAMMGGTIDRWFKADGRDWAQDTKTKSTINIDDELALMHLNVQFNLYLWYLRKSTKRMPGGFVQDIIRRPGLRKGKSDSLPGFIDRIRQDAEARPEWYFMRPEYQATEAELNAWEKKVLDPIMWSIRLWQDGLQDAKAWLPCWPELPRFVNTQGLKVGMRKVDTFNLLVSGDATGLIQGPWHGSESEVD